MEAHFLDTGMEIRSLAMALNGFQMDKYLLEKFSLVSGAIISGRGK
eukprot:gene3811-4877_t